MSKNPMTQETQAPTTPVVTKYILRSRQGGVVVRLKDGGYTVKRMWNDDTLDESGTRIRGKFFELPKGDYRVLVFDSKAMAKALAYDLQWKGVKFAYAEVIPVPADWRWSRVVWLAAVKGIQDRFGEGFLAADRKIREAKKAKEEQNSYNGNGRQYSNGNGRQHHGGNKVSTAA